MPPSDEITTPAMPDPARSVMGRDPYSLMPVLLPLVRAKWVVLGVPLLVCAGVFLHSLWATPYYKASTRVLPPQYNQSTISRGLITLGGESALGNSALTLKNPTDLFVGILHSRTILDAVMEANDLLHHYKADNRDEARRVLEARTDIEFGKDGIVEITVEDADPQRAAKLANDYVRELQVFAAELARKEGGRRTQFFNSSLNRARQNLREADERLRDTEMRTGFTRLRGQDEVILSTVRDLRGLIASKEVQLRTILSYATEQNPGVQLLRSEIESLKQKIEEVKGASDRPPAAAQSKGSIVPLAQAPDALMEHSQRKRDVAYWESIVTILGQYTELGKMDDTRDLSLFQVLDEAVAPLQPSRPRLRINLILFGAGSTLITCLLVLARAYVRERGSNAHFASQWAVLKKELIRMPWQRHG